MKLLLGLAGSIVFAFFVGITFGHYWIRPQPAPAPAEVAAVPVVYKRPFTKIYFLNAKKLRYVISIDEGERIKRTFSVNGSGGSSQSGMRFYTLDGSYFALFDLEDFNLQAGRIDSVGQLVPNSEPEVNLMSEKP